MGPMRAIAATYVGPNTSLDNIWSLNPPPLPKGPRGPTIDVAELMWWALSVLPASPPRRPTNDISELKWWALPVLPAPTPRGSTIDVSELKW
jgi:hypothetical protein